MLAAKIVEIGSLGTQLFVQLPLHHQLEVADESLVLDWPELIPNPLGELFLVDSRKN
jgi:hypothetical protein